MNFSGSCVSRATLRPSRLRRQAGAAVEEERFKPREIRRWFPAAAIAIALKEAAYHPG